MVEELKRLKYHVLMLNECINKAINLSSGDSLNIDFLLKLDEANYHLMHAKKALDRLLFQLLVERRNP